MEYEIEVHHPNRRLHHPQRTPGCEWNLWLLIPEYYRVAQPHFPFLSVVPIVSLFVAFFILLITFHLYSSPVLYCSFGKTSAKRRHLIGHVLDSHIKGTFTVIIDCLLPTEWLNAQTKAWTFSGGLWNRLNVPSH